MRNLCFGNGKNRFNHDDIGWNYRMTNIQAAMGCGQLKNIKWIIKKFEKIQNKDQVIEPISFSYYSAKSPLLL